MGKLSLIANVLGSGPFVLVTITAAAPIYRVEAMAGVAAAVSGAVPLMEAEPERIGKTCVEHPTR